MAQSVFAAAYQGLTTDPIESPEGGAVRAAVPAHSTKERDPP